MCHSQLQIFHRKKRTETPADPANTTLNCTTHKCSQKKIHKYKYKYRHQYCSPLPEEKNRKSLPQLYTYIATKPKPKRNPYNFKNGTFKTRCGLGVFGESVLSTSVATKRYNKPEKKYRDKEKEKEKPRTRLNATPNKKTRSFPLYLHKSKGPNKTVLPPTQRS